MCTYIIEKAEMSGSAKGQAGWITIDSAHVYYDHPFHAPLDHSLNIDFVRVAEGSPERIAVELSAESARRLVTAINAALAQGEAAHASVEAELI